MTRPDLHVTRATADDARAIELLLEQTDSRFDIAAELARAYARLLVARPGPEREVIAFLLAWHVADEVHVIDIVVAAAERRRGVARALLELLVLEARSRAARLVLLEVRKSNAPAIALYQSLGFSEGGERPRYYGDGEDALLMRLELPG